MRDTRIQKAMADQGLCSRRQAEQIIQEGRVKLNGRPVQLGDKMDTKADILSVDGQRVYFDKKKEYYYYMLNKPRGYITTSSDDRGRKTVLDLVKDTPTRVYPIGRLDKDSEGLLLFTNDGNFANQLTHPSHQVSKLYRVTVRPNVTEEQLIALANGVYLDDGSKTLPAVVRVVTQEENRSVMEISIKEGKNRQVRRMCAAVGLEVARLRRNAIGPVKLGMLAPGKMRELKPSEVNALKAAATKAKRVSRQAEKEDETMGMVTMKPIEEYDVIDIINNGRFEGDLYGYVLSDGGDLFGYTLFKIEDNTTVLLDSTAPGPQYLDGIIRASIAYGEARGAEYFSFNMEHEPFAEYKRIFFGDQPDRMKTTVIFSGCKHD